MSLASLPSGMAEKIPGWLERVLLPQISELKGELKAINSRMDGEFRVVHSEIKRVEETLGTEIKRVEETLGTKIDDLNRNMDVTRRLAAIEEQVKELRAKA
jgi:uncharacterized protein YqgV (UPF0045/DUF77 family)